MYNHYSLITKYVGTVHVKQRQNEIFHNFIYQTTCH